MHVTVNSVDRFVLDTDLRMPFHFGDTEVTESPHLFVRAAVELDGEVHEGIASEGLSPTWFLKDVEGTFADRLELLLAPIESACDLAETVDGDSVFDYWRRLYEAQREWAAETDFTPLVWAFGVTLVERAVIDAFCRATETTFAEAVRENTLGVELGSIHPELDGVEPAALLPEAPLRSTTVRHTVGFTDPLTDSEVASGDRLADGLPQSLAEYVRTQALTHFKIKLVGDAKRDISRLTDIAAVLETHCDEYVVTLDANEQYSTPESFQQQWKRMASDPTVAAFFDHLSYVEQPIARDEALDRRAANTFAAWADRPPIIIDESDGDVDSLRTALDCGYNGTSHKNCKGVFKGLANACYIRYLRQRDSGETYVLSGEDLSVVGPVGLQQDLAVTSTLGLSHVERNGHHYFRGTDALPASVQEAVLTHHGDLYRRHEGGFATVDIRDGEIEVGSTIDAPFGYALDVDVEQFTPLDEWEFDA